VPEATARLVRSTRESGGRVVAVGTTVVRALESAVRPEGSVQAAECWTQLVVDPEHAPRAVDAILTGWHEPEASHLLLLEAIGGRELIERSYRAAVRHGYLWHEFGDVHLVLP
jgi:S-adenosylmethionine:tRNA ribosyltransferase-isomerase